MSNAKTARTFAGFIAVLIILGFVYLYGSGIFQCWTAPDCRTIKFQSQIAYVATGLAGLVGGVVAMIFNEKLPATPNIAAVAAGNKNEVTSESGAAASIQAASAALTPSTDNVIQSISAAYAIIYFAVGIAAIGTWLKVGEETPDLIKNLALITMGLILAIGRSFFSLPPPEPR